MTKVKSVVKQDINGFLPDRLKFEQLVVTGSGVLHKADYKEAGEDAIALVDIDLAFDIHNPAAVQYLGEKTRTLAKDQVLRLEGNLEEILRAGFVEGQTVDQISAAIATEYKMERGYRTERIARTEVISAGNRGARDGYKQAGVKEKSWLSSRDNDVRRSHELIDIETSANPIGIDELFVLQSGASGQEPGNTGEASEDINCRCALLPEIEESE